jgi:hypothetical protein
MVAATLNVTADATSAPGYVTVWPAGVVQPGTSSLNADRLGLTAANMVTVPVTGGKVSVVASMGTDLIVDLFGWYERTAAASGGRYVAVIPDRVFDSRNDGKEKSASTTSIVPAAGRSGIPTTGGPHCRTMNHRSVVYLESLRPSSVLSLRASDPGHRSPMYRRFACGLRRRVARRYRARDDGAMCAVSAVHRAVSPWNARL